MARGGFRPGAGRKPKPGADGPKDKTPDDPHGDKAWLEKKRSGVATPGRIKRGLTAKPSKTLDDEEAEAREHAFAPIEPEAPFIHRPPPKVGRPTEYKPEYAEQAEKLCKLGATDFELGDFFEVSSETIRRWTHKHEEFCAAIKAGKQAADERVERSLFHKAVGYTHKAVKIFMPANAAAPVYAEYIEHVAPDTTAGIFWLKNRRPQEWRDKREVQHSGAIGNAGDLTDAQLAAIATGSGDGASEAPPSTSGPDPVH